MPNLTAPIPSKLTGNNETDIKMLKNWGTALIDELRFIINNLDAGNVSEAAEVKAENINTNNAKITNAQIGVLTADKLIAGNINTNNVSVSDQNGNLEINGSSISISDQDNVRFKAAYNPDSDVFTFALYNDEGLPTVYINSLGNAIFSGMVNSSEIYSSTIIGTDVASYETNSGGVFPALDQTGIKIYQDENSNRLQKLGMSVGDDGTAYMVLGAGDGSSVTNINGVVYSRGSFNIKKDADTASLGIVGTTAFIYFFQSTQELWLSGDRVLINGKDVLSEIDDIKDRLSALEQGGGAKQ